MTMTAVNAENIESETLVVDFFELLKPKVMSLVVFTGFAGMTLAPGFEAMHPLLIATAIFALAVGAGASGAVNMWYDRDIDAVMQRTKDRPIVSGRIAPGDALAYAVVLTLASVAVMGLALNWLAAGLLAFASFFYVFIYTAWLKRRTDQNIVIGGAAGAFPPLIGWAAISGEVSVYSVLMFLIIFLWTPPHFWALSLFSNEDYKRANIPMMTVTAGPEKTKNQMIWYTTALVVTSLLPYFLGYAGALYLTGASIMGGLFFYAALLVRSHENLKYAKIMFGYSVFYLFALFLLIMLTSYPV